MKNIEDIRASIDSLDDRIVALLAERLELSDAIADAKRVSGGPVSDPARERVPFTQKNEKWKIF